MQQKLCLAVCIILLAILCCVSSGRAHLAAVSVPCVTQLEPQCEVVFNALSSAWKSRVTSASDKRFVVDAASSREDVVQFASSLLQGPGDIAQQEFAVHVLSARRSTVAFEALVAAMQQRALPSKIRLAALGEVETLSGKDMLLATDSSYVDHDQPLEKRIEAVLMWLRGRQPLVDGQEIGRGAEVLSRCVSEFAARRAEPSIPDADLESYVECISLYLELLQTCNDSKRAAGALARHLENLLALPYEKRFENLDGALQYQALCAIQLHIGPIHGLSTGARANIEPISNSVIEWWRSVQEDTPLEWHMERLSKAGYRTNSGEDGRVIGAELLRAVREGTDAETLAAAAVLAELRFTNGTVPLLEDKDSGRVSRWTSGTDLVRTLVRAQVALEASATMMAGRVPVWDDKRQCWIAEVEQ